LYLTLNEEYLMCRAGMQRHPWQRASARRIRFIGGSRWAEEPGPLRIEKRRGGPCRYDWHPAHRQSACSREEMATSSLPPASHNSTHSSSLRRSISLLTHREGADVGDLGEHAERPSVRRALMAGGPPPAPAAVARGDRGSQSLSTGPGGSEDSARYRCQ
jgi:hypothetical protein